MISSLLVDYSSQLLTLGVFLSLVGSVWLLFAGYQCDPHLARRALFFPIWTLKLVCEYPGRCLKPFFLNCFGCVLLLCGIFGKWMGPSV